MLDVNINFVCLFKTLLMLIKLCNCNSHGIDIDIFKYYQLIYVR